MSEKERDNYADLNEDRIIMSGETGGYTFQLVYRPVLDIPPHPYVVNVLRDGVPVESAFCNYKNGSYARARFADIANAGFELFLAELRDRGISRTLNSGRGPL